MKNFKRYFLIVACATSNAAIVFAGDTPENTKSEIKENVVAPVTVPVDKDKQIVPAAPAISTEQNQIVKDEESLAETLSEKIQDLDEGLTTLLNNTLDKEYSKEDQEAHKELLANWICQEWTKEEINRISKEDFKILESITKKATSLWEKSEKDSDFSITKELILLDDYYKPLIMKNLFPLLAEKIKDLNPNERTVSFSHKDETSDFSFYSYSYVSIPQETCDKITKSVVENFKKLPIDKQLFVLAAWFIDSLSIEISN
jgi:hypothetical protein